MAQLVVKASKSHLVTSDKLKRIEELFNVKVVKTSLIDERSFVEDGRLRVQQGTTFVLHLSSSTSQKSVEEAVVYLEAVLEESPDFTVKHCSLTCEEFEMVRQDDKRAVIEYQCKAVLEMDPMKRELCIKGQRENTEDALQQVQRQLELHRQHTVNPQTGNKPGQSSPDIVSDYQLQLTENLPAFQSKLPGDDSNSFDGSVRDVDNNVIQESSYHYNYPGPPTRSCSLTTDSPCSLQIDTSLNLLSRGSSTSSSVKTPTNFSKGLSFAQVVSAKDRRTTDVAEEEKDHKMCTLVDRMEEEGQLEADQHPSKPAPCSLPVDTSVCLVTQDSFTSSTVKTPRKSKSSTQVVSATDNSTADVIVEENNHTVVTEEDQQQHRLKEEEECEYNSAASDEDSGVSVVDKDCKLDQRYESHLGYAVKLGYTEDDLDRVINRQGLECDQNKLVEELLKSAPRPAVVNPPESEGMSKSPSSASTDAPDIASSAIYKGVLEKVSKSEESGSNLRNIIIDGSNVAMSHGKNVFSCQGIKIAVDWFRQRGHKEITVFVPQWRKETSRPDTPITDQNILTELDQQNIVVFTPSRRINGRRMVCYDDRYVLNLAAETNGIVVSNDNFRDLLNEKQEYRTVVDERLLMYSFANDRFMPPEDPLGRGGPTLDNFLCKEPTNPPTLPPECPYGRKCTYGNKCKYHHPERGSQPHKSVTEVLKEQASLKMQRRALRKSSEPQDKPSQRVKPKLTRTCSLVPGESLPSDKNSSSSQLPQGLREPDVAESCSRVKSPTRVPPSKTSDYLREHRKKLEEALAKYSTTSMPAVVPTPAPETTAATSVPIPSPREVLSPVPALGSRVSSPSHLNVPYSSSQEGVLVSGHLLLAKKLSDDESTSNRASPTALAGPAGGSVAVSRQESTTSTPFSLDTLFDSLALQDHHYPYQMLVQKQQQYFPTSGAFPAATAQEIDNSSVGPVQHHGPARQLSAYHLQDQSFVAPGFGVQCQSFPMVEKKETPAHHNMLRRVTSQVDHHHHQASSALSLAGGLGLEASAGLMGTREHVPVKPQLSGPPSHFLPSSSLSSRPFKGMMRQNSSSDTQLYVADSGLDARSPQSLYSSALDHRGPGEALSHQSNIPHPHQQPGLSRSTSMQPFPRHQSYSGGAPGGLDRQTSEIMFSSSHHDQRGMPSGFSQYSTPWDVFPNSLSSTPTHQPPPHQFMGVPQSMPPWQPGPMPQHSHMPPPPSSPVKQRSFPEDQPIPPTDRRYGLYYHLCSIFAEPRVRAVMNKFPDELDPGKLCSCIIGPSCG